MVGEVIGLLIGAAVIFWSCSPWPAEKPTLSEALPPRGGPHAGSASLRVGKEKAVPHVGE